MAETTALATPTRKRNWLLIAAVVSLGFVACALTVYFILASHLSELSQPTIIEGNEPISLTEVRRLSSLPFPESATKIRYACYSQFIAFTEVLCFEAPAEDCKTFAEKVVAANNRKNPDRSLPGLRPITPSDRTAVRELIYASKILEPLKAPWFCPESVRSGMVTGESGSHRPMIWIDLEKGVLYYLLTD